MIQTVHGKPETHFLTLPDGRRLAYARYGAQSGRPLFYLHGLPGSRYECQLIDAPACEAGVSVIAPDRPGYGLTPLRRDPSLCAWTNDIAALADRLGIDRFGVIGVSGGGPCALACAHEMPERVRVAALVASLGPISETSLRGAMKRPARFLFYLANQMPALFRLIVAQPVIQLSRIRPEWLIRLVAAANGGPDKRILLEPPILQAFTLSIQACFQQGALGSMQDLRLFRQPWGFELGNIRPPVHLWHGELDKIVPPSHSRHLHSRLPNSSLDIVPQEGHFSLPLKHMRDFLETVRA
ncbi:MAG TPA: alpha/beta hydrolase [Gammaproteobacteria bacterium]|nr:alpha/beta hydrolase [Gammaproteobacteria bacterium]